MRLAAAVATVVVPAALPVGATTLILADEDGLEASAGEVPVHARLAPILRLSGGEVFRPVSRDGYVKKTSLIAVYDRKHGKDWRVPLDHDPTAQTLPGKSVACDTRFQNCHFSLKIDRASPPQGSQPYVAVQDAILRDSPVTVYWRRDPSQSTIQYWFLYVFNDWKNRHESDWEQITIELDEEDQPVRLGYSSHGSGQSLTWPEAIAENLTERGQPIVQVALGSHANYFRAGVRYPKECTKRLPRRFCDEHTDGLGTVLRLGDYVLRRLDPPAFHGDFGSGNFAGKGPLWTRISKGVAVEDPQVRKKEWKRPREWLNSTVPADGERRGQPIGG